MQRARHPFFLFGLSFLIGSIFGISSLFSEEGRCIIRLDEALSRAKESSPILAARFHSTQAKVGEKVQASLLPNPELYVSYEWDIKRSRDDEFDEAPEFSLDISQQIDTNSKRCARVKVAQASLAVSKWEEEIASRDLWMRVVSLYIDAVFSQENYRLKKTQVETQEKVFQLVQEKALEKQVTSSEVSQAKISLLKAKIEERKAQSLDSFSKRQLSILWDSDEECFDVSFPFFEVFQPSSCEICLSLLPLLPEMQKKEAEITFFQNTLLFERKLRVPDIIVTGGIEGDRRFREVQMLVGVSFPLPFFDRNQGNIQRACSDFHGMISEREELSQALRGEIESLHQEANSSYMEASGFEEILKEEEGGLDGILTRFQEGKLTYQELLEAYKDFYDTYQEYLEILKNYHQKRVALERLIRVDL